MEALLAERAGITPDTPAAAPTRAKVALTGCVPPLTRLDPGLGAALGPACRHLSLSTNNLDRLAPGLAGLDGLRVLSVGRNCLKRLDGLEPVAATLEELWASYNAIERLAGVDRCPRLRVLYLSNNRVRDWAEVDRLAALEDLEDLLLAGNPLAAGDEGAYRANVLRRLPRLKKLDGRLVGEEERAAALHGA